jgi:hypothetical protein
VEVLFKKTMMKKYIDYLFWKRTWFRMFFVMIPTWLVPVVYLLYKLNWLPSDSKTGGDDTRLLISILYLCGFGLGILDNENVDSPSNPFKKTPKRFKNWVEASKYLGKEIVVECVEMPDAVGVMTEIKMIEGKAYIKVSGHNEEYFFWRCRPKN